MSMDSDTALTHSMGQRGFKYLSSATYADGNSNAIQCITDCTVTTVSIVGDSLTTVDFLAGSIIVGRFSSVTIAGNALVYIN